MITREEMATMRPWELEEELEKCQRQLANARAALAEVDSEFNFSDSYWWSVWRSKHSAALKAALERVKL